MDSHVPSVLRASRQAFDAEECARRTRILRDGLRRMGDAHERRCALRDQYFQAHEDGMRAVAAHDSATLFGAIVLENEAIADQMALVREVRQVLTTAYGIAVQVDRPLRRAHRKAR